MVDLALSWSTSSNNCPDGVGFGAVEMVGEEMGREQVGFLSAQNKTNKYTVIPNTSQNIEQEQEHLYIYIY